MPIDFPSTGLVAGITTYTSGSKTWIWNGVAWDSVSAVLNADIIPLDDLSNLFNGIDTRFVPRYQGNAVTVSNQYSLLLSINGIIQYIDSPDYVWISGMPRRGFFIDSENNIQFSEAVPSGSEFDARIMPSLTSTTRTRAYPFKALDILLGG